METISIFFQQAMKSGPWSMGHSLKKKRNACSLYTQSICMFRVPCYTSEALLLHWRITFSTKTCKILSNLLNTRLCNIISSLLSSQTRSSVYLRETGSTVCYILFVKIIHFYEFLRSFFERLGKNSVFWCVGGWCGYESIISSAVSGSRAFC